MTIASPDKASACTWKAYLLLKQFQKTNILEKAFPITAWSNCFWRIGHFTKTWKLGDY